jgi:autotransporter-associated beta strand protein
LTVDGSLRFGQVVSTPVISPASTSGGYVGAQTVTITCATTGSTIHYTTNSWTSTNTYTGPILLPANISLTLQAYATATGMTSSGIASANYTIEPVAVWVGSGTPGSWGNTLNWTNNIIPNNPDATVDFSQLDLLPQGGDHTVTLDEAWTAGNLVFGDAGSNNNWTVSSGLSFGAPPVLTLAASNRPVINVLNQTATISAPLSGVSGLTKTGNGTLVLSGANNYSGGTVLSQGTLELDNLTAADSGLLTLGDANTGSHALQLTLGTNVANAITVTTNGTNSVIINYTPAADASLAGAFTLNRPTTISATAAGTIGFSSKLSGSVGTLTLNGGTTGQGFSLYNAQNDFVGTVVLASGHMATWPGGVPATTPFIISSNATYYLGDAQNAPTLIGSLAGQGTVTVRYQSGSGSFPQTLCIGNDNGSGSFAGVIANGNMPISVIKTGFGTETFSGLNTYTGTTTVSNGTLLVNGSLAAGSAVTVTAGATLGGTGTLGGIVTLGGTLSPGDSVGTLTSSNQTWNGGAAYRFQLSSATNSAGWDLVNITGTLSLAATSGNKFTVKLGSMADATTPGLVPDFDPSATYTWVIATASGGIQNFDPSTFVVDASAFSNPHTGSFGVTNIGTSLAVTYTPGSAVQRPAFVGHGVAGGGGFQLTFSGPTGQSYRVLGTNVVNAPLASWPVLTNATFSGGGAYSTNSFIDTGVLSTSPRRFYIITSP